MTAFDTEQQGHAHASFQTEAGMRMVGDVPEIHARKVIEVTSREAPSEDELVDIGGVALTTEQETAFSDPDKYPRGIGVVAENDPRLARVEAERNMHKKRGVKQGGEDDSPLVGKESIFPSIPTLKLSRSAQRTAASFHEAYREAPSTNHPEPDHPGTESPRF